MIAGDYFQEVVTFEEDTLECHCASLSRPATLKVPCLEGLCKENFRGSGVCIDGIKNQYSKKSKGIVDIVVRSSLVIQRKPVLKNFPVNMIDKLKASPR